MALDTHISNQAAATMLDALVDSIDGGVTAELQIYVGAPNVDAAVQPAGANLANIVLQDPAFGAATVASPSVATLLGVPLSDTDATASGEAGCFWAGQCTTPDTINVGIIQGTAGTATTDLVFDDATIVAGGTVAITAWTISMPTT